MRGIRGDLYIVKGQPQGRLTYQQTRVLLEVLKSSRRERCTLEFTSQQTAWIDTYLVHPLERLVGSLQGKPVERTSPTTAIPSEVQE